MQYYINLNNIHDVLSFTFFNLPQRNGTWFLIITWHCYIICKLVQSFYILYTLYFWNVIHTISIHINLQLNLPVETFEQKCINELHAHFGKGPKYQRNVGEYVSVNEKLVYMLISSWPPVANVVQGSTYTRDNFWSLNAWMSINVNYFRQIITVLQQHEYKTAHHFFFCFRNKSNLNDPRYNVGEYFYECW